MISLFAQILIVVGLAYLAGTLFLSRRKLQVGGSGPPPDRILFLVPALNEEQVIESTIHSLLAAARARDRVLVVDDGSDDSTAERVRQIEDVRVALLRRRFPAARQGKGRALNHAYRLIREAALRTGVDPDTVVLCIVDADGRIAPDAGRHVSRYFTDPTVGAVQLLVRIRNRATWLARFQDFEFLVFSSITQTAREYVGSVGLGGNGQFTRLSALMTLGDEPWSDCLTEDLDLGIRLAINGWRNRFCGESQVDQQGLTTIGALIRQRTRWAQGHFQCWKLIPGLVRSHLSTTTVLDYGYYLMAPAAVLASSVFFTGSAVWIGTSALSAPHAWMTPFGGYFLLAVYLFSTGPAVFLALLYWRRSRDLGLFEAVVLGHLLALYNYVWYIAEWRALGRIAIKRRSWTKTSRVAEPMSTAA